MKQATYFICAKNAQEREEYLKSNLCFISDWSRGWFDVPECNINEFSEKFNKTGYKNAVCNKNTTTDDIYRHNCSILISERR